MGKVWDQIFHQIGKGAESMSAVGCFWLVHSTFLLEPCLTHDAHDLLVIDEVSESGECCGNLAISVAWSVDEDRFDTSLPEGSIGICLYRFLFPRLG